VAREPSPKLFTVEEANQLLPQVRKGLQELQKRQSKILRIEQKKAVEELSWLREDGTVSPKAQATVSRLDETLEDEVRGFEEELERFSSLGAQLKDLGEGLVDFYAARGGTLVFLCWKEGEDQVRYWHDLESGFAGRRSLEQF